MHRNKILVVDDEEHICELIKSYFSDDYDVSISLNGKDALAVFEQVKFNLVILDIMLPEISGWEVCKGIRRKSEVPIIMLTAKGEDIDKIVGLELGADDYVTKPFNPRELLARVKAVLRRFSNSTSDGKTEVIEYPGIKLNNLIPSVKVNGKNIELTPKEFELLWLFASNPGIVFSREQIIQKVWGYDFLGDTRAIDSTIKRLRRKLEADNDAPYFIQTVWGWGYKFEVPKDEG